MFFFTFCIRGLRFLIIFFYRGWMSFLGLFGVIYFFSLGKEFYAIRFWGYRYVFFVKGGYLLFLLSFGFKFDWFLVVNRCVVTVVVYYCFVFSIVLFFFIYLSISILFSLCFIIVFCFLFAFEEFLLFFLRFFYQNISPFLGFSCPVVFFNGRGILTMLR